ncbi:MAG TPA: nuclear transport factor 2 family protein [Rhodocyclaceae bacterium]|nr:nuclear transport factor 2 family protein [Rhodocyclaceae bacterium]HRQ46628.1 nuclear transport factor 2 family protein [Rhodocyclaceae bacterium]
MKHTLTAGVFTFLSLAGSLAHADTNGFPRALQERYDAVEEAIKARDGERWFAELYSEDIVLFGEGASNVIRGRAELMPVIEEIVNATQKCTIVPDAALQTSGTLGYSFVTYDCVASDAAASTYQVRALFVWRREQVGWRVVAEGYTMGSM